MALADEIPRVVHAGNNTLGPFPLIVAGTPITYADRSEIRVTRYSVDFTPTVLVDGNHYTLDADAVLPDVGEDIQTVTEASLTLESDQDVLGDGEFILAERVTTAEQSLHTQPNGGLSSAILERQFDVLMRHVQELKAWIARAVLIHSLDTGGDLELPVAADRAGKIFGFDDDGNPRATTIEGAVQGDDGAPGSQIYLAAGAPSDASGVNGDIYINITNGDIYDKVGGAWGVASGNLKGPQGNPGAGSGDMLAAQNLNDVASKATSRANLAVLGIAANLSDLASATTARTNLGLSAIAVMAEATALQYLAATAAKVLTADKVWAAAAMGTLTDAATVVVDQNVAVNFDLTLGGNRTLGAMSNAKPGSSGVIYVTQDGSGSRALAYHANYKWAGGVAGVLSTGAGVVDRISYFVRTSSFIELTLTKAIA